MSNSILELSRSEIEVELEKKYPGAMDAVRTTLKAIGEDPDREGLKETPYRVVKSFLELYGGYEENPKDVLSTFFSDGIGDQTDEIVMCKDITYYSACEHHMIPFFGTVHIGYLPNKRVIGLSKLARLVDCFSRRLQIQEKMCSSIADALEQYLEPQGVGVIVTGKHLCMCARGAKQDKSEMITSAMRGKFKSQPQTRSEFLQLIKS